MHAPSKRLRSVATAIIAAVLAAGGCWKVDADLLLSARELNFGTARTETSIKVTNDSADKALTSGVTALDYTFTSDRAWVTVTPSEGHLDGEQSATHTVSIDRGELADGENVATIKVTSNGGNENIAVIAYGGDSGCSGAPSLPSSPAPGDEATGVSLSPTLSWGGGESQCDQLTATYDIYFGTRTPPPFHHNNGSSKSWETPNLVENETYYWRVVAKDANGSTAGSTWSFRTSGGSACNQGPAAPAGLTPEDGATNVALNQNLSWSGGESRCEGLTATYNVYFGTSSPAPFHHDNGTAKSWDPGTLDPDRTYYWRVVAKDANGSASSGERSFHTLSCTDNFTAPCNPSPPDDKDNVNPKTDLSWGCGAEFVDGCDGSNDVSYFVYLGTSAGLDESDLLGTTTSRSWKLDTLRERTTYYWRVVAKSGTTSKSSPVWSFKTR